MTGADLVRILREPKNSLIRQYVALLSTEGVRLHVADDAIEEIASVAQRVNERTANIGARRLHTILEKLLDEISFTASDVGAGDFTIDREYVQKRLEGLVQDEDLSRYIL